MAIIYTYPQKQGNLNGSDLLLVSDSVDNNETKSITLEQIKNFTGSGGSGGGLSSISGTSPIQVSSVSNNSQIVSWSNPYTLDLQIVGDAPAYPAITLLESGSLVGVNVGFTAGTGISLAIDPNNNNNLLIGSTGTGNGSVTSVELDLTGTGLLTSNNQTQDITTSGTFAITGVLNTSTGGTGLSTIGSANQVLQVKNDGTGLEYVSEAYAAERIIEDMAWIGTGSTLVGTAVHIDAPYTVGGTEYPGAKACDAILPNTMACVGLALNIGQATSVFKVICQGEAAIDTSTIAGSPSIGDIVYVASQPSNINQNLTVVRPVNSGGVAPQIQSVGTIQKVGAQGIIQVSAIHRPNDLPQLVSKGGIWAGDADGTPTELTGPTNDNYVLTADTSLATNVKWAAVSSSNLSAPGSTTEIIRNLNNTLDAHYGYTHQTQLGNAFPSESSITTVSIGKSGAVGSISNMNQGILNIHGMNPNGGTGFTGADQGTLTLWCSQNNHSVSLKGPEHAGTTPDNYSVNLPLVKPAGVNNTLMWDGSSTVSNNNYNLEWADSSGNNIWTRVSGSTEDIYFTGVNSPGRVGINVNAPAENGLTIVGNLKVDNNGGGEVPTTAGQAWVTPNAQVTNTSAPLDFNRGNVQEIQLTDNVTVSLANLKEGATYIVVVRQSASASYTVTWPSEVKWVGTAPVMTTVQSAVDVYSFICTKAFGNTDLILGTASQNYTV